MSAEKENIFRELAISILRKNENNKEEKKSSRYLISETNKLLSLFEERHREQSIRLL